MAHVGNQSVGSTALLLALLLVSAAVAPLATPVAAQSETAGSPPSVDVTVERGDDPAIVRLRLTFDAPSNARAFWVLDHGGTVVASEGFVDGETKDGDSGYRWDRETESPSLTVVTSVDETSGGDTFEGKEFAATEAWTLAPTPTLTVAWLPSSDGEWRYRRPFAESYPHQVSFAEAGALGQSFLYVGQYEEYTRRSNGKRFRLVVAPNAEPATPPKKALDALAAANRNLPGESPDSVLAFVLPDPIRRGGFSSALTDEFWVHEDAALSTPSNLWVHEYVHTRQSFSLGTRMRWFREASAGYFAARSSLRNDRIERATVVRAFTGKTFANATLSKPATWSSPEVPYYRGPLVLWALDRKIRDATGGERGLGDVFDRMNAHEGNVTYADFRHIVGDVAGQSMDGWLDRYVATSERPDVGQVGVEEPDGGLDDRGRPALPGPREYVVSSLKLWGALALAGLAVGVALGGYVSGIGRRLRGED